jgi:hypothetical protein
MRVHNFCNFYCNQVSRVTLVYSTLCMSNVLKDLKGVRSGLVWSGPVRLYLLSSHVSTLAHRISTFYCMYMTLHDEATSG